MDNSYLDAIILGLVQGLTEFLPVSSSGHLVIFENLLGYKNLDLLFNISVHVGTLLAVVVFFFKDLKELAIQPVKALFDKEAWSGPTRLVTTYPALRLLLLIFLASVPTAIIGLAFKDTFERLFQSLTSVGIALCLTGILLMLTRFAKQGERDALTFPLSLALLVGLFQALAITPGISRSGATICIALFLGARRDFAGKFSFLISIPAILGAELIGILDAPPLTSEYLGVLAVGLVVAGLTGYIALRLLMSFVRKGQLHWFSWYCLAIGIAIIIIQITRS